MTTCYDPANVISDNYHGVPLTSQGNKCVYAHAPSNPEPNDSMFCNPAYVISDGRLNVANRIQTQKIIQKTVRVPSSLYTMNLGVLTNTMANNQRPWNNQSDQVVPSVQRAIPNPKWRPGGAAPGGEGCDIKNGSYDRYLRKLKGKMLKQEPVPAAFLAPTRPFSVVRPIYGDKQFKLGIIGGCVC